MGAGVTGVVGVAAGVVGAAALAAGGFVGLGTSAFFSSLQAASASRPTSGNRVRMRMSVPHH